MVGETPKDTMPMITKLGKVVTYHDKLSPLRSYDPLINDQCVIT